MFSIENSMILAVTVLSAIAVFASMIALWKTWKKNKEFQAKKGDLLSPQRDYVESILYNDVIPLTRDPGFFADASHILFENTSNSDLHIGKKLPDFSFFENMGINLSDVKVDDKMIACLMPFNKRFDRIRQSIVEACNQTGFNFRRSDDELIANNTDIRKSIVSMILEAKVIVAVLDGRNPNVFYEIGIAQSMGKLVLLVANLNRDEYQQTGRRQPVDLLSNRLITYNNPGELKDNLVKTLKKLRYDDGREEEANS